MQYIISCIYFQSINLQVKNEKDWTSKQSTWKRDNVLVDHKLNMIKG